METGSGWSTGSWPTVDPPPPRTIGLLRCGDVGVVVVVAGGVVGVLVALRFSSDAIAERSRQKSDSGEFHARKTSNSKQHTTYILKITHYYLIFTK